MNTTIPGSSRQPRLLILDDDSMTGLTMARVAQRAGFNAQPTTEPEQFFALASEWEPDVIALDLIMPSMDGVAVINELAARSCKASVVITSGAGSRVLDAAARSANAHGLFISDVLAKPFSSKRLKEALGRALTDTIPVLTPVEDPPLSTRITRNELAAAIEQREITTVYQPKVRARTGTLVGFETLARWNRDGQGSVPPQEFIALAEQHDLIDALTEQVMDQALPWLAELPQSLRSEGHPAGNVASQWTLSLNISARSLNNSALFERLLESCHRLDIAPQRIVLEVTETNAMRDARGSLDNLTRLRLQGFQLSIDDFGTGYSSMLQLVRLPFSEIKIDKGFVMTASQSAESRAVIRSIVELGRSLGLQTIAEGVETREALDYLREIGCDLAQGYLYARPLASRDVSGWLKQREAELETQRLRTLHGLKLLDSPTEPRFDRFTRLACRITGKPMAQISLLDRDRQWFKARHGLELQETPRHISFCDKAMRSDEITVVRDALKDDRFRTSPLVTDTPRISFYAGRPLCMPDGTKVGTFSVMDRRPGLADPQVHACLEHLGDAVERELNGGSSRHLDSVTRLPYRHHFRQEAEAAIALCRQLNHPVRLLCARLDTLASLNQIHGMEAGDRLLAALAACCLHASGQTDLLGRSRGTEITALFMACSQAELAVAAAALRAEIDGYNAGLSEREPRLRPQLRAVLVPAQGRETRLDSILELESSAFTL